MTRVVLSVRDPNVDMSQNSFACDPNVDARNNRRMKTNENRGSMLLKPEENEQVFRLIGNRCQCLAAGICQLYLTEAPLHREWIKKNVGVITLIKDGARRSFYLRLYCLQRRALVWEHEVYHSMEYKAPLDYFHTFEAEDCMAAFNFASETDAMILRNILLEKLNRRHSKNARTEESPREAATLPRKTASALSPMGTLGSASSTTLLNGSPSSNLSKSSASKKKDKKKKKDTRLSKDQIGLPTDFRHVSHLGWNPKNGMQLESLDNMDPSLRKMINDVGISEKKMKRKKMQDYLSEFIEGIAQQKLEDGNQRVPAPDVPSAVPTQKAPPPIPVRTIPVNMNSKPYHSASAPPPLPPHHSQSNVPLPAVPAPPPVQSRPLPSRPPPPTAAAPANTMLPPPPPPPPSLPVVQAAGPPPPPPPMEGMNEVANADTDDPRSQLMESIRSGATTLKKVNREEIKPAPATDARSDLLSQIRQGIELKPVSNEPKSPSACADIADVGIAGALLRVLKARANDIHSDSEDSTSDSDSDDWDDD